jgi:asparagine synthetase B (glutamine-hydrolysing)
MLLPGCEVGCDSRHRFSYKYLLSTGYIGLGSRRSAILYLSPVGHMPMCNEDRSVWITCNGETYNFAELRREVETKATASLPIPTLR